MFVFVFMMMLTGLISLWGYRNRSAISDIMDRKPLFTLKTLGGMISKYIPKSLDLDTTLRLAGEDIDTDTFIALVILLVGGGIAAGLVLYLLGLVPFMGMLLIPLLLGGSGLAVIMPAANENRKILRIKLMEFVGRMEMVAASGISTPGEFAVRRAARNNNLLGQEMRLVTQQMDVGVPLYEAFEQHFFQRLGIDEAQDVTAILRDSAIRGSSIIGPLHELNRDFCFQRENAAEHRLNRVTLLVAIISAAVVGISSALMIAGPFALSIRDLMTI